MSNRSSKKLIRAQGDLVLKLSEMANREGKTLYSYVSEVLEQALRASKMRRNLKEILDVFEIYEILSEAGAVLAPRDILDFLIENTYYENKEHLQKLWQQTGQWYGFFIKGKFNDALDMFLNLLKNGRFDLNEVNVIETEQTVELRCVSPFISQERTQLIQAFIEGALSSLGYEIKRKESFKGIIHVEFTSFTSEKN